MKSSIYNFSDGGLYYGELNSNGLPESEYASCTWPNGVSYVGAWVNGTMSGIGTLNENGKFKHGLWWKGELVHEFEKTDDNVPLSMPSGNPANSQKVIALIIGNNNYKEGALHNCVNDANAIAEKLQKMGINVIALNNATKEQMLESIAELAMKSDEYKHVFFYFSGHGVTNQGRHYILAINEAESEYYPISLEMIDSKLSTTNYENIILISDACTSIAPGNWDSTPVDGGLKTIMSISTSFGQVSYDGIPGQHSPYAYGLLEYLDKPRPIKEILEEANTFTCVYAYKVLDKVQVPTLTTSALFPKDFCLY